jgi:mannose-6-phosphate isomerase
MIFKFEPLYMERIWGGNAFSDILGRNTDLSKKIGESWEIVDREAHQSVLSNTKKKITIRSLLSSNPSEIMGPHWKKDWRFPILVKWLDCNNKLSLQVHPPKEIADKLGGEPKTENWYIAHASKGAGLFIGLKKESNKQRFVNSLKNGTAESECHWVKSNTGDSILVQSGRIHAIDAGNLILEIQQNSDTTYRVFDWNRKDENGNSRELHIKESIQSINFEDFEPRPISDSDNEVQILANCSHFRIRKMTAKSHQTIKIKGRNKDCHILSPIDCTIEVGKDLVKKGCSAISPYSQECIIKFKERGSVLITDGFSRL